MKNVFNSSSLVFDTLRNGKDSAPISQRMTFAKKCGVLSLALIASAAANAADPGADSMTNKKLFELLKRLEASAAESNMLAPTAAVSVGGKFNFTITVNRVSTNTEPMACDATVMHFNFQTLTSYHEAASGKVKWSGNIGTCTISIPYIWKNADTTQKVSITTGISPYHPCDTTCVERPISRYSDHDLQDIALPANGTVTNIKDTFSL